MAKHYYKYRKYKDLIKNSYYKDTLKEILISGIKKATQQTKRVMLREHIAGKLEVSIFTNLLRSELIHLFYTSKTTIDKFINCFTDSDYWKSPNSPNFILMFNDTNINKILTREELEEICMTVNLEILSTDDGLDIEKDLTTLKEIVNSVRELNKVIDVINDRATVVISDINKELVKLKED
jgi:hypothetical protein